MVDGETRGVRGVGWGCRGRGPPCGPPGKPQGAQGPRRLSGRLLLWPPPPPRLTSCRRCGKMLARGHTGGVRSAVHRPWCDKSPVVFATTGLCYTWETINATIAALNASNATKPRYFVAFGGPKQILSSSTVVWSVNTLPYLAVGSRPSSNLKQCLIGCFRPCACRYDILEAQKLQRRKFYERGSQCVFSDF